ncbi:MAG: DUF3048 domain-containing protein [Clostridia bacterium]|nr:DUF3048 domain-containing protein [Clostridia bacterium]
MKNKFLRLILILTLALFMTSCAKAPVETGKPQATAKPAATPAATEKPKEPEPDAFYTEYINDANRPIAVMIDNDNKDAWPQAGLSDAYLVYEITVEGSATRLMALFPYSAETAKIGPVRSSRHYFLDYALEHDAIYTHFGWSPKAMNDIPALGVNNINGIYDAAAFWRENKFKGDYHSAYTSIEKIKANIGTKGYRTNREKTPLNFAKNIKDIEGQVANSVNFAFAGFYSVKFMYNAESGTYARYVNGNPYELQEKVDIAAENIIVMTMNEAPLGDGSARINIFDVGEGTGYYITRGKYIPITWSKADRDQKTVFKDAAGKEIELNPGQTWIEIVSPKMAVTIE